MHLNEVLGKEIDDVGGDCPNEAGTIYHVNYLCDLLYLLLCFFLVYLLYFYCSFFG
jgi:hypothetical protein